MKSLNEFTNQEIFEMIQDNKTEFFHILFKKYEKIDKFAVDFQNRLFIKFRIGEYYINEYPGGEYETYDEYQFDEIYIQD